MEDLRIILAGLWITLMLTYLLGVVMRIFTGDFTSGELGGMEISQLMLMLMSLIMLIPIIMILLSLTLTFPIIKWVTIIAAITLFVFNIIGLSSYPGIYDKIFNNSRTSV